MFSKAPSSEGAFFGSSVSRFPKKEGGRPAHGIDSAHNKGESPSLLGRFFWSGVSRFPEKEGGRPAHGIDSAHNEGESPSLLLTSGVPVARASVTTSNHPPHLDDENPCAL